MMVTEAACTVTVSYQVLVFLLLSIVFVYLTVIFVARIPRLKAEVSFIERLMRRQLTSDSCNENRGPNSVTSLQSFEVSACTLVLVFDMFGAFFLYPRHLFDVPDMSDGVYSLIDDQTRSNTMTASRRWHRALPLCSTAFSDNAPFDGTGTASLSTRWRIR